MNKLTYTLTETDKKFQTEIKTLIESGNSHYVKSIFIKIQIGIKLVEMKLKNPIDFDSIIPKSIMDSKTRNRRMKLVINKDCDFTKCMKVTKDKKTSKENSKLLIFDKRVVNLTETDISNIPDIYNGGLTKVENMKMLEKPEWDLVVGGDNTPFETLMDTIKSDKIENSDTERDKHQPKGMDRNEFLDMVENGIYPVIQTVYEFKVENEKLEKNVNSLERKIKSLEKSKNENLQKISELNGILMGMESVSGNLKDIEPNLDRKKV